VEVMGLHSLAQTPYAVEIFTTLDPRLRQGFTPNSSPKL
jgi:hypothetical protein